MSLRLYFFACALLQVAQITAVFAADLKDNPLSTESVLPYQYPPFDKIKDEHFVPAIEAGMRDQLKEIEPIANNSEKPTFDNTIVAFERTGRLLDRAERTFSNLNACDTNPARQKIDKELAPKLAAHRDEIFLNPKLFARVKTLYDKRGELGLDPESAYLLERYYKDFVRAGARLSDADKEKLKKINAELATLQTQFEQNVLKERNASSVVVDKKEELAGLTDDQMKSVTNAAKAEHKSASRTDSSRGEDGKFAIQLQNTTGQPLLGSLQNRALRERIMQASLSRNSKGGELDTRDIVLRTAHRRAEKAKLLGYANWAAYQLEDQTAHDVSTVNKLLADLAPPAVGNAKREAADMQKIVDEEKGGFEISAGDWDFYSEKVRKAKYNFDESEVRPYYELNHVIVDGVFYAAQKLYGLTFKERHDLPVYEPDVRVWEVFDRDGKPLAIFIGDYYARASKRGGAWMNAYVPQNDLFGTKPVVANHLNIPKPPPGEPTLLTQDEVRTAFHEFGHALHGMFSNVKYPRFSGTSVPRDFVEYPSQVNEMWATWPEVLGNYAKHYKTGEPIPQALLDKVNAAEKFNQGFKTTEYLSASLLDQAWHQLNPSDVPKDAVAFEAEALHNAGVDFPPVPPRYRSCYFSHAFAGGYSAGYYSYIWSEVLDADTVEWFKQHGGLKRENGDRFRAMLLSRGGSADALELFKNFVGRDPYIEPLLKRRGLDRAPGKDDTKTEASASTIIPIGNRLFASPEAKDIIRDKSPDGKFALQITKEDQSWGAAIINLKNKDDVVGLEIYQNFTEEAHLVWSKDSQRVAYFEPDRRGGSTTVYFRKGSVFEEVSLPYGNFPACQEKPVETNSGDKHLKALEATTRPVKWLDSGELVLAEHSESLMESGATRACGQTITIAFDSDHKASVKSAKQHD